MIGTNPCSRLAVILKHMKARCRYENNPAFPNYGGRGIIVCDEWRSFLVFADWALTHGYAEDRQIDRIDNDGPYSPENCRWVSQAVNVRRRELEPSGAYLKGLVGKLTDQVLADVQVKDRAFKLSDGGGLCLWVSPKGAKRWRYNFTFQGKAQILTIGPYPSITLLEARELHAIARAQKKRGRNPAEIKQVTKARRGYRPKFKIR